MRILNKKIFYGNWRSVKVFTSSGVVKYSRFDLFLEFDFNPRGVLTIKNCSGDFSDLMIDIDNWGLIFKNGKYYLIVPALQSSYEVITIEDNILVLLDLDSQDKIFFARVGMWTTFLFPNRVISMWN